MAFDDDPEPVKGGRYMGMLIKKVTVTEKTKVDDDGCTTIKRSFKMSLEGGVTMTEDRYVRSSSSSENGNKGDSVKGASGNGSSSGHDLGIKFPKTPSINEIEKERERKERLKEKQKRDEAKKQRQRQKEEKERRRNEREEANRKRREEEEAAAAAEAAAQAAAAAAKKKNRKVVSFGPTTVSVLPEADPDLPDAPTADGPRAIWKFTDDDSIPEDYDLWKAQDVILFPGDYEDNNSIGLSSEDNKSDDQSDGSISFSGIWGYAPSGSVPGSDVVSLTLSVHSGASGRMQDLNKGISDLDCEFPPPIDVWVYPPGVQPPEDFPNHGKYAFAKKSAAWPPPIDEAKRENRVVGRIVVPDAFLRKANPQTITVYSKWKMPKSIPIDESGYETPLGEWRYSSFDEENDDTLKDTDKWAPQDVVLYPPDQEPPASDEASPQGIWVTKQNLVVDPDDPEGSQDRWAPPQIYVYPPGVDPIEDEALDQDNVVASGTWTYPIEPLKKTWPPPTEEEAGRLRRGVGKIPQWDLSGKGNRWKPQTAHIFPRSKAPSSSTSSKPKGIWKYRSDNEPKGLDDWETQEVMMYPTGHEPEGSSNGKPHGVWGLSVDAELDETGNWKPQDIWFYGPSERPGKDCAVQGTWSMPLGKLDRGWPPKSTAYVSPVRKVGKLKIPGTFNNNNPPPLALSPTRSPKTVSPTRSPKKKTSSSLHSKTTTPSPRPRDNPPVSPLRHKSMSDNVGIPFDNDNEQEEDDKDQTYVPAVQPIRLDTDDSNDINHDADDDSKKKSDLGDFRSPFDTSASSRSSSSSKKKSKTKQTSLKSKKKKNTSKQ